MCTIMDIIYDEIGKKYDTTRKADPTILSTLTKLLTIEGRKRYLDIACGTGNYASGIANIGGNWFAFDNSEKMLSEAKLKTSHVDWKQFDVTALGYENDFFDGAVCTLAIHHFLDLDKAFSEVGRVLKPKSKLIIFTATPDQMESYWLNHYFPKMMDGSCREMPSLEVIQSALNQAKISIESTEPFFVDPDLQDFFLYSGKQMPEMYLSSLVRNGISSFHKYCSKSELSNGLNKLRKDIKTGAIKEVMEKYESINGDYVFISSRAH